MQRSLLVACVFFGALTAHSARAGNVVVGVNAWYRPPGMSQEEFIKQLADNGVKTIRTSLMPNTIDFITQAYHHSIGSVVIVYPHTGSTAKKKQTWADVPLSELNPQEFTAAVKPILDQLEAGGMRLTAFELGNEINTSGYNGDIARPGSGRLLGLADLNNPTIPRPPLSPQVTEHTSRSRPR